MEPAPAAAKKEPASAPVDAMPACGYREVRLATSSAAIGEDLVTREYARATHLHGGECLAIGHAAALTIDRHYAQIFKDATVLELGTGCGPGALLAARLGARKVYATDRHRCLLDGVAESAAAAGFGEVVVCEYLSLSGALPRAVAAEADIDVVIAIDQAYTVGAARALVNALANVARKTPHVKVLLFAEDAPTTPACVAAIEALGWGAKRAHEADADDVAAATAALSAAGCGDGRPPAAIFAYELQPPRTLFVAHTNDKHARPLRADSFINKPKKREKPVGVPRAPAAKPVAAA